MHQSSVKGEALKWKLTEKANRVNNKPLKYCSAYVCDSEIFLLFLSNPCGSQICLSKYRECNEHHVCAVIIFTVSSNKVHENHEINVNAIIRV